MQIARFPVIFQPFSEKLIPKNFRKGAKHMELRNSQTFQNLINAFAGESQAHIRYKFLAYAAKQQKLCEVEKAIKVLEENEFNHARMFYTAIQSAGSETFVNLQVNAGYPFKEKWDFLKNFDFAIENETEENTKIYPQFSKTARDEGLVNIADLFDLVSAVEACHAKQLTELRDHIKNGTLYNRPQPVKWKCAYCGHEEVLTTAWEVCPLCKAQQGDVMLNLAGTTN